MRREGVSLATVLGSFIVAALLATVAVAVVREDAARPAVGCGSPTAVRVSTTAEFAPIVEGAVDRLAGYGIACTDYDVVVESAADAALQISGGTDLPQVWIPDSELWIARANEGDTGPALTAGTTLATTPVYLAVPGSIAQPSETAAAAPWQDILGGPIELRVDAPEDSTASLLTLLSAQAAVGGTPQGEQLLLSSTIRMSHQTATGPELLAQASGEPADASAVAASEQQILQHRADNPESTLAAVVPAEGLGSLRYSWVVVPDEDQDAATRDAVSRLGQSLMGVAGLLDRKEAGFRTGDGKGAGTIPGVGDVTGEAVADPSPSETEAILAAWDAAAGDHQILTVMDVSTSMLEPAGDSTRIELAADGLQEVLGTLPATDQVGLWTFSSDQPSGNDWTEVAPIGPLNGEADDSGTHLDDLLAESAALASRTGGGTGLYDTVRAAYHAVQDGYQPGVESAVVVVTDGRDDDTRGLYPLLVELQSSADPSRPVAVYVVGIGPDVYDHELRLIAELTGGRHLLAPDAADIGTVLLDALTRPYRAE